MLVDPAKQNSTMTQRHGGAWLTATASSSRKASPTQRLGDGSIITMEADAGADMTSRGGEDTADLPLEQQADDAAALEGGNQSSANRRPCTAANKSLFNYSLAELICRNVGLAVCRQSCASLPHGGRAPVSTGERIKQSREGCMTVAGQAFLLTGELFLLSFAAIFVIWFADRLRRDFIGKP